MSGSRRKEWRSTHAVSLAIPGNVMHAGNDAASTRPVISVSESASSRPLSDEGANDDANDSGTLLTESDVAKAPSPASSVAERHHDLGTATQQPLLKSRVRMQTTHSQSRVEELQKTTSPPPPHRGTSSTDALKVPKSPTLATGRKRVRARAATVSCSSPMDRDAYGLGSHLPPVDLRPCSPSTAHAPRRPVSPTTLMSPSNSRKPMMSEAFPRTTTSSASSSPLVLSPAHTRRSTDNAVDASRPMSPPTLDPLGSPPLKNANWPWVAGVSASSSAAVGPKRSSLSPLPGRKASTKTPSDLEVIKPLPNAWM